MSLSGQLKEVTKKTPTFYKNVKYFSGSKEEISLSIPSMSPPHHLKKKKAFHNFLMTRSPEILKFDS